MAFPQHMPGADEGGIYQEVNADEEVSDTEHTPMSTRPSKRTASKLTTPSPKRAHNSVHKSYKPAGQTSARGQSSGKTSPVPFKDAAAWLRHTENFQPHAFICVFAFAGCTTTCRSKNEWKRHTSCQHLCLRAWVCELDDCGKVYPTSQSKTASVHRAEFNRKDLFMQHLRRMHSPFNNRTPIKKLEWEKRLKELQVSCLRVKRQAPTKLRCPVESCGTIFEGERCLNERMEHVGTHLLEAGQDGSEVRQERDELLVSWALREGIIEVRPGGIGYRLVVGREDEVEDRDAEGEDSWNEGNSHLHDKIEIGPTLQHPIVNKITAQYDIETEDRVWTTGNGHMIRSEDTNPHESDTIDDRKIDSGYHTGLGTDTASVMSCDYIELWPGLSLDVLHDLITNFTNILLESPYISDWASAAATVIPSHTMEMKVAAFLEDFTEELLPLASIAQDSKNKTEACLFIRRNKERIARCFREGASTTKTAVVFNQLKSSSIEIAVEEKIRNWESASEMICEDANEDFDNDENQLPIEFSNAKEFLISSPPFQLLLERFQTLYYDRDEKLSTIRNLMTSHLDPSSRALDYATVFEMHWNLPNFMKTQYNFDNSVKLESVIIISGSALYCQATTSAEYLKQNWPGHGPEMLGILQAALDSPELAAKVTNSIQESIISVNLGTPSFVKIAGSKEYIVIMTQVLAWIGTAFQISDSVHVRYSKPCITHLSPRHFSMKFLQTSLVDAEQTCWLPLFYNPVIAKGFPIPHRKSYELGIEMPLEMMAALNGAEQAVEYGGGLVLKGFSSMLVPVKRQQDSIQWHLIGNTDGRRIKYSDVRSMCPRRLLVDKFGHDALHKTRAFLAWWKTSESYVGTDRIRYEEVERSKANRTSKPLKMTDISVGFQNWGALSVNFRVGLKDTPRHVSIASRLEVILGAAEEMNACLYDVACKRAWLVSGTEVLLYLVHLKHQNKPYTVQGKAVKLVFAEPRRDGSAACKKALMEMASVPIFKDVTVSGEDFCVKHLVQQLWKNLEKLEEKDEENGIPIKMTIGTRLKGHEIMDLVLDRTVFRPREVALENTNGGWPGLLKASDTIVLFGSRLGELIKPGLDTNKLCSPWVCLPESKDYLATTTRKLLQLLDESDKNGHPSLFGLRVHKSALLFEDCPYYLRGQCRCERLQQIISKSLLSLKSITPPGPCPEQGCIIIGRAQKALKSPRNSSNRPIFCLPNSQILPVTPDPGCETPSHSEEDDPDRSSGMPTLDLTPTTSISQDARQNDETFSTRTFTLNREASVPTTGGYSRMLGSIPAEHSAQSSYIPQELPTPQQNFPRRELDDVYQVPKSDELPQSNQTSAPRQTNSSTIESSSLTRASYQPDSFHQELMQNTTAVNNRSHLYCQGRLSSSKALGKQRAVDGADAYSALNAKPSHRLRRMPHLGSRGEGV